MLVRFDLKKAGWTLAAVSSVYYSDGYFIRFVFIKVYSSLEFKHSGRNFRLGFMWFHIAKS